MSARSAPRVDVLLRNALGQAAHLERPPAFILAGHNGSGKSTLWSEHLAPHLQVPLLNADRMLAAVLPHADALNGRLPTWAARLRDTDGRWQRVAQEGTQALTGLAMSRRLPFAFETVFSHWQPRADGSVESKADTIVQLQKAGYFVVLLFVGLASAQLSMLRVQTRRQQGGHAVPEERLAARYPRTQRAIRQAAPLADLCLMFDNSRSLSKAYTLVRAQQGERILFDCRQSAFRGSRELVAVVNEWLPKVTPDPGDPPPQPLAA